MRRTFVGLFTACLPLVLSIVAIAAEHRVLPAGTKPDDRRLGALKDLDGYFPFAVPTTREAWDDRAAWVRRQLQVALGLWPIPELPQVQATIHGKVERDDYTVERVYFESYPGHFVSGSLFRPKRHTGKRPGVLCPHGHWDQGRFYDAGPTAIRQQLATGAERFEISGRYPLQARCAQLARMGCVVFHYDMIGYADSQQMDHRPNTRERMNTATNWGFFSPQAELRLQTMMGLQTLNSVRALDWLCQLDDVDPSRIAVTGASGGGTQTLMLCAVDPRPAVSFPAVMVSTAMQGGCTCENCSYLRIGTGNVEIAGLFAPKPLGMTAADDWTHELETKGLPELRALYGLLEKPKHVMAAALTHFPHNYNYVSRAAMYGWMNRHLELGFDEPIVEEDFIPLSVEELTVWNDKHPRPLAGDEHERALLRSMTEIADRQIAALAPRDAESLARYREVVGGAFETLIGRTPEMVGTTEYDLRAELTADDYMEFDGLLNNKDHGEVSPVIFLQPNDWNQEVVVWLDERGKAGLFGDDDAPTAEVRRLLDRGYAVAGIDLLHQGESLDGSSPLERQPMAENTRWTYAGYTFGYNYPLYSQRVHDVVNLLTHIEHDQHSPTKIHLIGLGRAGIHAAGAAALSRGVVDRVVLDTRGFRFASLDRIDHPDFVPGIVKYGDVPALVALVAPCSACVLGEDEAGLNLARSAYAAEGARDRLHVSPETGPTAAVDWLLSQAEE